MMARKVAETIYLGSIICGKHDGVFNKYSFRQKNVYIF
jgi:hypothetical protein